MLLVLALLAAGSSLVRAKESGTGNRAAREAAQQAIPWRQLNDEDRRRVSHLVTDATLYRSLPTRVLDCDGDFFAYLVANPEVVVDSWNVLGVSRLKLDRLGPNRFRAEDTAGAVGEVRVLHQSGGGAQPLTVLLTADGVYQAPPMPKPIRGSSVLLLRATTAEEPNGRCYVTTQLDAFIRFDRRSTELVARTLQPLIMRTADHNFIETMRFVSLFSRTAETNPEGMVRLASQLPRTEAATRREFATASRATAARYAQRATRQRVALSPTAAARQR